MPGRFRSLFGVSLCRELNQRAAMGKFIYNGVVICPGVISGICDDRSKSGVMSTLGL